MLDRPCSEVVWRVLATHCIHQFPPSLPLPCVTVCHHISTGVYFLTDYKRTSPFKSARWGASVQSTAGSRGVRISGSDAGYTVFRGSVKGTCYPLHLPVSPSLPFPCVTVCHHFSTGVYFLTDYKRTSPFKSASGGVSSVDCWQPRCAASAVVMLDTPCSEVVWRVLATHCIHQFPPSLPLQCVTVCHHISTAVHFLTDYKRTSPFKSARWGRQFSRLLAAEVCGISGSNAGYTVFRGSVKGTGYPPHLPVSPSLPITCVTVCHHISSGPYL